MKVHDVMTPSPYSCRPHDSLEQAARLMADHGIGCVAICDQDDMVVGLLTDRDVCLAAYNERRALESLEVAPFMSSHVHSCRPGDDLEAAAEQMRTHRVRRLAVTEPSGKLVGLLSIDDLAVRGAKRLHPGGDGLSDAEIARTLSEATEIRSYGV